MASTPRKRRQRNEEQAKLQKEHASESGQSVKLPKKKLYRQRAHANPFSDHQLKYPISPDHMDWSAHFPEFVDPDPANVNAVGARKLVKDVEVVDIGCGFGGLLVALAPMMPDTLMIGMEIRIQVLEYVRARIQALRVQKSGQDQQQTPGSPNPSTIRTSSEQQLQQSTPSRRAPLDSTAGSRYQNISGIRANTMKFLPNFFSRAQLHSIFICFPDPHFKARKHKARIVSQTLNAEYAFVLRPGGKVYTITDVEELHQWMVGHFERETGGKDGEENEEDESAVGIKSLWERISEEELAADPCVKIMMDETEEGKKVARNNGRKFVAVWRRKPDPAWPSPPQTP